MNPSSEQPFALLVLGSGPAGMHAAAAYLESGGPGAVCVLTADTDEPYQRPPLSKAVLSGKETPEVTPILEDASVRERIDVRLGVRVDGLDRTARRVRTQDGHDVAYERLVLATGSEPIELPGVSPGASVHVLRSLADARGLVEGLSATSSVAVVGSGFIGCEAAASLASRGLRTVLVSPEQIPQEARLGPWVGSCVARWLTSAGVELRLGRQVAAVGATGEIELDDGSVIVADQILAAVGVTQSRAFIEGSGLPTEDGRVVVDQGLRTSDPRVWAAGDVALARHSVVGRSLSVEHWGDAITMGALAGRNAAADGNGRSEGPDRWSSPPGFWSDIGNHTLKHSAWGDGFDVLKVVEHGSGAFTVWYADEGGELVGVLTHERDEDYERGQELLTRRATLDEALHGGR